MLSKFLATMLLAMPLFAAWGEGGPTYGERKYSFEDAIYHDNRLHCDEIAAAGANVPEIFQIFIGDAKRVELVFETYQAKDVFIAEYQGELVFDSGCVGTSGYKKQTLLTDGFADTLTIKVLPNCLGSEPTTQWKFYINCQ